MATGPRVGSSSVAWDTPAGVITSIAFGTVFGATEQTGAVPPAAHTQNVKPWVEVEAAPGTCTEKLIIAWSRDCAPEADPAAR